MASARYIIIGKEIDTATGKAKYGGDVTTWNNVQFPLRRDLTSSESIREEEIIVAQRDLVSRWAAFKEVSGPLELQMASAAWFDYVLGARTSETVNTNTRFTWTPVSLFETLPSFKLEAQEGTLMYRYHGLKVDRFELMWELDEDVAITLDLMGQKTERITAMSETFKFATDVYPITFESGKLTAQIAEGTPFVVGGLRTCTIRCTNNLERRPALNATRTIADLKPRRLETEAEFTVDSLDTIEKLVDAILAGSKIDLELQYTGTIKGIVTTITILLENALSGELRDTIRGLDIYEVAIPCRFIGTPTAPSIKVEQLVATTVNPEQTLVF